MFIENDDKKVFKNIFCILNSKIVNLKSEYFHNDFIPNLNFNHYVKRIVDYFNCSSNVYICALIYILKIIENNEIYINKNTIYPLFFVSCVISVKTLEDDQFSNKFYAQVGGYELDELNNLEIIMLNLLDFNTYIEQGDFYNVLLHPQICNICYKNNEFFNINGFLFNMTPIP